MTKNIFALSETFIEMNQLLNYNEEMSVILAIKSIFLTLSYNGLDISKRGSGY